MEIGFNLVAAKPKREQDPDEAPSRVSMKPQGIRRNPSTDQKKVRRQMALNRTASDIADITDGMAPEDIEALLAAEDSDAYDYWRGYESPNYRPSSGSGYLSDLWIQGQDDAKAGLPPAYPKPPGFDYMASRHDDEFFGEAPVAKTADATVQARRVQVYLKGDKAIQADPDLNTVLNNPSDPRYERYNTWMRQQFRPYEPGDQVYLGWEGTVRFDGSPEALLEALWHDLNVGDEFGGSQLDPAIWRQYRSDRNRSLSVGDVVTIDGQAWKCDSFGWSLATGFRATASTNDNWWLPKIDTEDDRFDYVVTQRIGPADYKAYNNGWTDGVRDAMSDLPPNHTPGGDNDGSDYDKGYIDGYRSKVPELWGQRAASAGSFTAPSVDFGSIYGSAEIPAYITPHGAVWIFRKRQTCRFYNEQGEQVGPEQSNVAPAVAYALSQPGWVIARASLKVAGQMEWTETIYGKQWDFHVGNGLSASIERLGADDYYRWFAFDDTADPAGSQMLASGEARSLQDAKRLADQALRDGGNVLASRRIAGEADENYSAGVADGQADASNDQPPLHTNPNAVSDYEQDYVEGYNAFQDGRSPRLAAQADDDPLRRLELMKILSDGQPDQDDCPNCGSGQRYTNTGYCPQCQTVTEKK